jgi:hypothetical protein
VTTVGDVLRFVLTWILDNETIIQQVWHYLHKSGGDQNYSVVLGAMVTSHTDAWNDHLVAEITEDLVGTQADLYLYNPATGFFDGVATSGQSMDGSAVGERMAHGVAALVKFPGVIQRYQGRKYIAGLTEGKVADSLIGTTTLANLALWAVDADDMVTPGGDANRHRSIQPG